MWYANVGANGNQGIMPGEMDYAKNTSSVTNQSLLKIKGFVTKNNTVKYGTMGAGLGIIVGIMKKHLFIGGLVGLVVGGGIGMYLDKKGSVINVTK